MKHREPQLPEIPPFVDQWGRAVWTNPYGQNRPNVNHIPAAVPTVPGARDVEAVLESARKPARGGDTARRSRGRTVRRAAAVIVAIGTSVGGMTAASAYFTAAGSGNGEASAGTVQAVTFAAAGSPTSLLVPNGSADVTLKLDNPNAFAVKVVGVAGDGAATPDAGHPACTTTGVTFNDQNGTSLTPIATLPASSTNNVVDLAGAVSMSTSSSNGCQGATFTVPVTVTVQIP